MDDWDALFENAGEAKGSAGSGVSRRHEVELNHTCLPTNPVTSWRRRKLWTENGVESLVSSITPSRTMT
jgi:hypothetical protein